MNLRLLRTLLAAVLMAAVHPALAQDTASEPAGDDPVLAMVNGDPIYRSDVVAAAGAFQIQESQVDALIPMLLDRVIDSRLVGAATENAGLDDDPAVLERMAEVKKVLMRDIYLQRVIDEAVTDEAVQAAYDKFVEANPPAPEVHARHILVETEEEAKAAIARLDDGEDFVELAKELSTGPSGPNGGDLDFFTEDQMVEPFGKAAFALEPGSYTEEPVKTQFGWHVILVEEKREGTAPTLAVVEEQLRESLGQQAISDLLDGLRAEAEIDVMTEMAPEDGAESSN